MWIRVTLMIAVFALMAGTPALSQVGVDVSAVKLLVTKWNEAHTIDKLESLSSLYGTTVNYYGSVMERSMCISKKRTALKNQEDFRQTITSDLVLSAYSSGVIRCDFVKTVSSNNKEVDYKAYLIIEEAAGNYIIVGESDLTTDRNIKNEPDLGTRIAIRDERNENNTVDNKESEAEDSNTTSFADVLFLAGSVVIGAIGLLIAFRRWQKPIAYKSDRIVEPVQIRETKPPQLGDIIASVEKAQRKEHFEKGFAFEKFVVQQFGKRKRYFKLIEWRSDKYHEGIFPESNRNPDLVYRYKCKDFVKTFSVECKYRRRPFNGLVQLMNEYKYRGYETYHMNEMPVYIALGLGGEPDKPSELYLIPFRDAKLEMTSSQLFPYRKSGSFFYDMENDRLT